MDLPGFLVFANTGAVLTPSERSIVAHKKGVCVKCGRPTFKVRGLILRTALTNLHVFHGTCLGCYPEKRPPPDAYDFVRKGQTLMRKGHWTRVSRWWNDHADALKEVPRLHVFALERACAHGAPASFVESVLDRIWIASASSVDGRGRGDHRDAAYAVHVACRFGVSADRIRRFLALYPAVADEPDCDFPLGGGDTPLMYAENDVDHPWRYRVEDRPSVVEALRRGSYFWQAAALRRHAALDVLSIAFMPNALKDFDDWYFSRDGEQDNSVSTLLGRFLSTFPVYMEPEGCKVDGTRPDGVRQLPMHRALFFGLRWRDGLDAIYNATNFVDATATEPDTLLRPFQLAASHGMLDESYILLHRHPEVIQRGC